MWPVQGDAGFEGRTCGQAEPTVVSTKVVGGRSQSERDYGGNDEQKMEA